MLKRILMLAIAALAMLTAWQVGSAELANYNFQEDLHDLGSAQSSFRFGNVSRSDEDIREAVIRKADAEGIELTPDQVTVRHADDRADAPLYLEARYSVPVKVVNYSFVLQFNASSSHSSF